MLAVGIIIMIVGFLGVLVCAKLRNQGLASVSAVVMIFGLILYMYYYLNPAPSKDGEIYAKSVSVAISNALKGEHGSKNIVWVVDENTAKSEWAQKYINAFKEAFGGNVEVRSPEIPGLGADGMDLMSVFKAAHLDKVIDGCDNNTVVVIDMMLPLDLSKAKFLKAAQGKGPAIFLTQNASVMDGGRLIVRAFSKGNIIGAISSSSGKRDENFKPDEDELDAAFKYLYVIVNKDNIAQYKDRFGAM